MSILARNVLRPIIAILLLLPGLCCGCEEGVMCNTTSVTNGICVRGKCHQEIPNMARENLKITIVAKYPDTKLKEYGGGQLFIRGNGLGLSWEKGIAMTKDQDSTWSHVIEYSSTIGGYHCHACADTQQMIRDRFEYRILRDDKYDMVPANFAIGLPLSEVSSYFITNKKIVVYPWFYKKSGNVESYVVNSPELGGNRTLTLYTPPSFYENNFKSYPVLFVLDLKPGMVPQHFFDDPISKYRVTQEIVVIGFGDYNSTERFEFLTPSRHEYFQCKNGTFDDKCAGCLDPMFTGNTKDVDVVGIMLKCYKMVPGGGEGSNMLDFLLNSAFPAIQTHTHNRLKTNRENIGIAGYSLGGLMACHAAWTRPRNFGLAACQSPSFWWPISLNNGTASVGNEFLTDTLGNKSLSIQRQSQRLYIDCGESEGDNTFKMVSNAVKVAHIITQFNGYVLDKNVWVNIYPGAEHTFIEWQLRLWKVLKTLFPSNGNF